jgi:hypothetical protein
VERAQYFGMERFDRQFSAVIEEEIAALQSGRIGPGAN